MSSGVCQDNFCDAAAFHRHRPDDHRCTDFGRPLLCSNLEPEAPTSDSLDKSAIYLTSLGWRI